MSRPKIEIKENLVEGTTSKYSHLSEDEKKRILLLKFAQDRERYKNDFYEFFKDAWKSIDTTELQENWHIKYQCFLAQYLLQTVVDNEPAKYKTVLINVPPRSLKSWIFNVALPVYAWTKRPNLPIITASYSLDLGMGFSRKSQQIINSNWFQRRYSDIVKIGLSEGGREAVGECENSEGGVRFVTSTGGAIIGKGMLLGILDDPIKALEANQSVALENCIRFYNESFDTRRNNPKVATVIIIMQRLAEGDIAGYLIENGVNDPHFLHVNLPAISDGSEKIPLLEEFLAKHPEERDNIYKNNYLFGDRWNDSFINDQKRKGAIFWATQFMQNPLPTDGLLFQRNWLTKISYEEFLKLERNHNLKRTFVCDTAYTDKTKNDATGILAYTTFENVTYIINFTADHVDSANLPTYIENYVKRNGYNERKSVVTIEPKGSGMVVISLMKKLTKLNVIAYKYPASAKVNINMSKEIRAEAVVPMVESGRVVLVEGGWNELFVSQVVTFPLGRADEAVDCMTMAILRSHYIDSNSRKFGIKRREQLQN
jgi:predicted phage terminase large subunit-like protein